jgi:hypothetical protein
MTFTVVARTNPCSARVVALRGIIFQSDRESIVGDVVIRPLEMLDRLAAGIVPTHPRPGLAMHAGLHLVLADGNEVVAEQLLSSAEDLLRDGLYWTPLDTFRRRDRGGWDLTVPATSLRGIDTQAEWQAIERLNAIGGRPFLVENCVDLIERVFGGQRVFADSPLARKLGLGLRAGDPALPLLRPDAQLNARAERLLEAGALRRQVDALADPRLPSARRLFRTLLAVAVVVGIGAVAGKRGSKSFAVQGSTNAAWTRLLILSMRWLCHSPWRRFDT